jgi:hypothetical protein
MTETMMGDGAEQQALSDRLIQRLDRATERLATTSDFAKFTQSASVLELVRRLLPLPGGIAAIYERVGALEAAGVFSGSDWAAPEQLQPLMAANTLKFSTDQTLILEVLSELRLLALTEQRLSAERMSPDQARQFLARILALNLSLLFGQLTEADRVRMGRHASMVQQHLQFIAAHIGIGDTIEELINEIWRIMAQRPIEVGHVKDMITSVAVYLHSEEHSVPGASARGAERLISALYGPTRGCQEDPGLEVYLERLPGMDEQALRNEALGFGRAMHDTGLVSPYHPVFLRYVLAERPDLIAATLGLSSTGIEVLACYTDLIYELIRQAVWPETAQAVYGLAGLLERGVLFSSPVAPALWRQVHLQLAPEAEQLLGMSHAAEQPSARQVLLAGVVNMLGHPLGIGQGNNPTCQSARALSMWSTNVPDYLLQVVAWAARDYEVVRHFEGQRLSSKELLAQTPAMTLYDVDPVSAVTVPHLDAIYHEMGRLCGDRGEDPHRWINPEFHGWWVGRGFAILVDVASGALVDLPGFVRRFFACYHPYYNGNNPVIHPQPAGIAVTDSSGSFVGWHAIAIERVALDPDGQMRVYFFNPNNDSTQDWGHGVRVATEGSGERYGESSLPIEQFVSRLYIFHYDPRDEARNALVPAETIDRISEMVMASWGAERALVDTPA